MIAHEIAHSWTGNLVTNANMEHFWLNEGFTTFLQRKIEGRLHGELTRHLKHLIGWRSLEEKINVDLGPHNPLTSLVVNLTDVNPDDAFSRVPYEKGATFLWMLEELVGGPDMFEPFLKSYIQEFSYKSIKSDDFKSYFLEYFSGVDAVQVWLYILTNECGKSGKIKILYFAYILGGFLKILSLGGIILYFLPPLVPT